MKKKDHILFSILIFLCVWIITNKKGKKKVCDRKRLQKHAYTCSFEPLSQYFWENPLDSWTWKCWTAGIVTLNKNLLILPKLLVLKLAAIVCPKIKWLKSASLMEAEDITTKGCAGGFLECGSHFKGPLKHLTCLTVEQESRNSWLQVY